MAGVLAMSFVKIRNDEASGTTRESRGHEAPWSYRCLPQARTPIATALGPLFIGSSKFAIFLSLRQGLGPL